jgi:hypothetical protein
MMHHFYGIPVKLGQEVTQYSMVAFLKKTFSPFSQPQLYVILLLFLFPLLSALPGRLLSSGFENSFNQRRTTSFVCRRSQILS